MEKTVYNPQKGRLETINIDFTDENTTWFDNSHENIEEIYMITDFEGGLIISGYNYDYPTLVYDISRSDINYDIERGWICKRRTRRLMTDRCGITPVPAMGGNCGRPMGSLRFLPLLGT